MLHESINPQKSYDGPMPNIAVVLKGELARLARKETRAEVAELRKASSQYRSHIAALRRRIEAMERQLKRLSKTSGRAKAAAESMLPDVLPQARLIIARPFNHTGPGQDIRFVLPSLAQQIADVEAGRKAPRLELGNLEASRDFLDVRDVCAAYIAMLSAAGASGDRAVYNVASGASYRIADLVEKFRAHARAPFEVVIDPRRLRPSDVPVAVGSAARLEQATGWKPTIGIDAIVEALLAHWRSAGGVRKA